MAALRTHYRRLQQDSHLEKELSFPVLLWLFVAGSLLGFVSEGIFHFLHHGSWGFRVGTLWGPFCVLYGFGAVVMYLVALCIRRKRPLTQFILFALTGSAVELLAGIFQKVAFGTQSWNYSAHALNLGGYVSMKMTLLWGMAGMALMYIILPLLFSSFNRLHLMQRRTLCRVVSAFMCVNLLLTCAALLRWQERTVDASPASNAVETYLDRRWPDERMRERFPNMQFVHRDSSAL